jgi:hypothetical protein
MIMLIGYDVLSEEDKQKAAAFGLVQINKPLVESLYAIARSRSIESQRRSVKLRDLISLAGLTTLLPITSDTQAYTVEHAKREFYDTLINSRDELKKRTRQAALKTNDEYHKLQIANSPKAKSESIAGMLAMGAGILASVTSNFTRAATVGLTNLVNNAAADEAETSAMILGVKKDELRVYKRVINDGKLCGWCSSFYTNKDGSPKVYTIKELAENGTNDGRPKSDWKPVLGSTHPRCRCQLHYLEPKSLDPK